MRFRVENLGPIKEAEVDLSKELIVLVGPNNSGKTYFAWAVYGFERFELDAALPSTQGMADALVAEPVKEHDLTPLLERGEYVDELAGVYRALLDREFAAPREHFARTRVTLRPRPTEARIRVGKSGFIAGDGEHVLALTYPTDRAVALLVGRVVSEARSPGATVDLDLDIVAAPRRTLSLATQDEARRRIAESLSRSLHRGLYPWSETVAFPVERLAINTFAKELAQRRSDLVEHLRLISEDGMARDLREEVAGRVERYPRAIRDALHDATRLDIHRNRVSPLADLADELEATVLGGKVSLSDDNVLEFTPDRSAATHLRIQQTASVVKSLASLVFYLRHRARGDERLIIDEPELNLHPDNQRKVARILAKLVNRGVQLIISTHSDYVIRELNNLIMLSQDSDAAREVAEEIGIQPEMTLRPERLGVYLFDVDGSCEEVEVSEAGFEVATIDAEIHRMNQDAQTIYYRLFDEE